MNSSKPSPTSNLSGIQWVFLLLLRVTIGWHFLYEGVAKIIVGNWTSSGFLSMSRWLFAPLFNWIASSPQVLNVADSLNMYGLALIGLGLIVGCLTRVAAVSGILLLFLYYVANPPLVGLDFGVPAEGHYLIVNKNLVELFALALLAVFPSGRFLGIDGLIYFLRAKRISSPSTVPPVSEKGKVNPSAPCNRPVRREVLKSLATMPVLGAFVIAVLKKRGWESYEERHLKDHVDAVTSATIKAFDFSSVKDLKGQIPHAKIKEVPFSRLILGGNLIGGWAHARDLIYACDLVKSYHTKEKVFQTFILAEKCGINAILTNPILCSVINEYWRRNLGKIKFIADCGGDAILDQVRQAIDRGAASCYVQGATADRFVSEGKFDLIAQALDLTRANGLPAGIGGHSIQTVKACVEKGFSPDYWMKTLHHKNYWSARHAESCDNIFCDDPEGTVAFMRTLEQPWIAFKTLAAGAIHPNEGFSYAFKTGADFICVGMYDFQIVQDANIALDALANSKDRERPWRAL